MFPQTTQLIEAKILSQDPSVSMNHNTQANRVMKRAAEKTLVETSGFCGGCYSADQNEEIMPNVNRRSKEIDFR